MNIYEHSTPPSIKYKSRLGRAALLALFVQVDWLVSMACCGRTECVRHIAHHILVFLAQHIQTRGSLSPEAWHALMEVLADARMHFPTDMQCLHAATKSPNQALMDTESFIIQHWIASSGPHNASLFATPYLAFQAAVLGALLRWHAGQVAADAQQHVAPGAKRICCKNFFRLLHVLLKSMLHSRTPLYAHMQLPVQWPDLGDACTSEAGALATAPAAMPADADKLAGIRHGTADSDGQAGTGSSSDDGDDEAKDASEGTCTDSDGESADATAEGLAVLFNEMLAAANKQAEVAAHHAARTSAAAAGVSGMAAVIVQKRSAPIGGGGQRPQHRVRFDENGAPAAASLAGRPALGSAIATLTGRSASITGASVGAGAAAAGGNRSGDGKAKKQMGIGVANYGRPAGPTLLPTQRLVRLPAAATTPSTWTAHAAAVTGAHPLTRAARSTGAAGGAGAATPAGAAPDSCVRTNGVGSDGGANSSTCLRPVCVQVGLLPASVSRWLQAVQEQEEWKGALMVSTCIAC